MRTETRTGSSRRNIRKGNKTWQKQILLVQCLFVLILHKVISRVRFAKKIISKLTMLLTLRHDCHELRDGESLGLDECLGLRDVGAKLLREHGRINFGQQIWKKRAFIPI